jgi:multidrug resistance efflux pump
MIAAFVILYGAAILVVFKGLKIKPRPVPIAVAVVVGVVFIGAIVIGWQISAPVSKSITVTRFVVQIVPEVTGTIKKIHAQPNVPLNGSRDLLFEIDPELYQYEVDQHTARLGAAHQTISQLEAAVEAAGSTLKKSEAELALAKFEMDTALKTQRGDAGAIAELRVISQQQKFSAATAGVGQAVAGRKEARFALESAKENIRSIQAQLNTAKYNLEKCAVMAPADGFVTYWSIREGTRVSSMRSASIGTFIDTTDTFILASFPQNLLTNVKPDDPVDIAFNSTPGLVTTGTVESLVEATGEGQFAPTGDIPVAADVGSKGSLLVKIRLDDETVGATVPVGAAGAVAIFTESGKPFQAVSKVYMRMLAWMNYLP